MIDLIFIFLFVAIGFCHYKKATIQNDLIKNEEDFSFIMKLFLICNPIFIHIPESNKNVSLANDVKKYRNYILFIYGISIVTMFI